MRSKALSTLGDQRTLLLVLDSGEDPMAALRSFARTERISGASFQAIGAFERATIGWFDFATRDYLPIEVDQQCEAISVLGDIAVDERGDPSVHAHAVIGLRDGTTRGGHLLHAVVRPTLEITITEVPAHLRRRKRPEIGAALIDLGATSGKSPS
jgi:predicted DNA-binding protein with PD1-like motif